MNQIGIDITSVKRLRDLVSRRPSALARLFTAGEVADAGTTRQRWPRLASRFAAKEALIKAAGGLHGSHYQDIEVRRRRGAPPDLSVSGALGLWLAAQNRRVVMSVSHEDEYAVAMVLLVKEGEGADVACLDR